MLKTKQKIELKHLPNYAKESYLSEEEKNGTKNRYKFQSSSI